MNLLGTKLTCSECGAQAIVVTGGEGTVECDGQAMLVTAGAADAASEQTRRAIARPSGDDDPEFY